MKSRISDLSIGTSLWKRFELPPGYIGGSLVSYTARSDGMADYQTKGLGIQLLIKIVI